MSELRRRRRAVTLYASGIGMCHAASTPLAKLCTWTGRFSLAGEILIGFSQARCVGPTHSTPNWIPIVCKLQSHFTADHFFSGAATFLLPCVVANGSPTRPYSCGWPSLFGDPVYHGTVFHCLSGVPLTLGNDLRRYHRSDRQIGQVEPLRCRNQRFTDFICRNNV